MEEFLGYHFKNPLLLEEALTTPSYKMQHPEARDNQRLEFLGDAVLGLLAADCLYATCPQAEEGSLTVRRAHMVSTHALCEVAARLHLAQRLRRNRGAAELPAQSKTLADAVEALMGAIWLDGGLDAVTSVFARLKVAQNAQRSEWSENPKGELQMLAQAMKPARHPEYTLLQTTGKSHAPLFKVRVKVSGVGEAEAEAGSLKGAEAEAAKNLLQKFSRG